MMLKNISLRNNKYICVQLNKKVAENIPLIMKNNLQHLEIIAFFGKGSKRLEDEIDVMITDYNKTNKISLKILTISLKDYKGLEERVETMRLLENKKETSVIIK